MLRLLFDWVTTATSPAQVQALTQLIADVASATLAPGSTSMRRHRHQHQHQQQAQAGTGQQVGEAPAAGQEQAGLGPEDRAAASAEACLAVCEHISGLLTQHKQGQGQGQAHPASLAMQHAAVALLMGCMAALMSAGAPGVVGAGEGGAGGSGRPARSSRLVRLMGRVKSWAGSGRMDEGLLPATTVRLMRLARLAPPAPAP